MQLRTASPCPIAWESMKGSNRVRFCTSCNLKVYNLAEMSPGDVEHLVLKSEGRLCGRLYIRQDRTATVSECPRSPVRKAARKAFVLTAVLVVAATLWILKPHSRLDRRVLPPLFRQAADWIDPEPRHTVGITCPTRPLPAPVPPAPENP